MGRARTRRAGSPPRSGPPPAAPPPRCTPHTADAATRSVPHRIVDRQRSTGTKSAIIASTTADQTRQLRHHGRLPLAFVVGSGREKAEAGTGLLGQARAPAPRTGPGRSSGRGGLSIRQLPRESRATDG